MLIKVSSECGKSELDYFTVPPTQIAVLFGIWDQVHPHPNFKSQLDFEIKGESERYIDLSRTELWLKLIVTKSDDSPLNDFKNFGLVNNFMHSIFSQVTVSIDNIEIENTNSHYAYRAYLENLLCFGREAKETFLTNEGFYKDTAGNFEQLSLKTSETVTDSELNHGLIKRVDKFSKNKVIEVKGMIHVDLFNTNRYLIPNLSVQLKFTRSKEAFYLLGKNNNDIKIEIEDAYLNVRKCKVNPSVTAEIMKTLEEKPVNFPIKKVLVKSIPLPYVTTGCYLTNIYSGVLPTRVVFGFVETSAYNGSFELNPFNFQNFGINYLRLKAGSDVVTFSNGIRLNYTQNMYLQGYSTLFQCMNGTPNDITFDDYKNGYALYVFDLTPDLCNEEHFNTLTNGSLELEILFDQAVQKSLTGIFYLEFDNNIEITKQHQVIFDYKS